MREPNARRHEVGAARCDRSENPDSTKKMSMPIQPPRNARGRTPSWACACPSSNTPPEEGAVEAQNHQDGYRTQTVEGSEVRLRTRDDLAASTLYTLRSGLFVASEHTTCRTTEPQATEYHRAVVRTDGVRSGLMSGASWWPRRRLHPIEKVCSSTAMLQAWHRGFTASGRDGTDLCGTMRRGTSRPTPCPQLGGGKRVVDAGCGEGFGTQLARRSGDRGRGTRLFAEAIEYCRSAWRRPN